MGNRLSADDRPYPLCRPCGQRHLRQAMGPRRRPSTVHRRGGSRQDAWQRLHWESPNHVVRRAEVFHRYRRTQSQCLRRVCQPEVGKTASLPEGNQQRCLPDVLIAAIHHPSRPFGTIGKLRLFVVRPGGDLHSCQRHLHLPQCVQRQLPVAQGGGQRQKPCL